jgi:hypothetical protein
VAGKVFNSRGSSSNLLTVMSADQSCLPAHAELPFGGSSILHRSASSASRKTRAGGVRRHPSGRKLRRGRFRSTNMPGLRACRYKTAPGRSNWPNRDPIGEKGALNLHAFVANSPPSRVDLLGLCETDIRAGVGNLMAISRLIKDLYEGNEPAVSWSPAPCDPSRFTRGAFVQVFRGGLGRLKGPHTDTGHWGGGSDRPINPPEYPLPPTLPDVFQDTPGGWGTRSVEFLVCQVCFESCAGRCVPGERVAAIGPCRRWPANYKGQLDDPEALAAGTISSMSSPPSWFTDTLNKEYPGFLSGECRPLPCSK